MKLLLFIAVVVASSVFFPQVVCSQTWLGPERALSRIIGSVHADWGIASGLFRKNMEERHGFGAGGEILYNFEDGKPVWAGLGVHSFAFDDHRLSYTQEFDGVLYTYEDRTVARVFTAHGVIRFQPEVRFFAQPYIQGALGMHWFYTNTKIKDLDLDEQVDRINEARDAVLGYALHAGIQIIPRALPDFRLDVRAGYLRNASVEYLRFNPELNGVFTSDFFEPKTSPVDIISINVGMTFVIRPE